MECAAEEHALFHVFRDSIVPQGLDNTLILL